ncbi:MAG: CDP-alcohol phosphatidyltransferase family protein [Solirubrobacterales bacterium]
MGARRRQSSRIRRRSSGRGPLGFRRRFGLDRSGPPPRETRPGQPLRPWTIPNAIGYLRLAAIPVFLVLAFESDGSKPELLAALLFWLIAVGDYVDGFVARATGQYSRMGALLDPIVDRLTILSGAAVCWHFELLPRWALAALAVRELITLVLAQVGLRRGRPLEINWFGRVAVFPIMGAIFWAMVFPGLVWDVLLVAGVVLAVFATFAYIRDGLRR